MRKISVIISFVIVAIVDVTLARNFPSYINRCKRDDPNLGKCFGEEMMNLRDYLSKGIPELQIPPIEPLHINRIDFKTSQTNAISLNVIFKDIEAHGARNFQVTDCEVDLDVPKIKISIHFDQLRILSNDYSITGRILLFPVNGHGFADGNYTDVNSSHELTGKYEEKNGKKYISWDDKMANLQIGKAHFLLENLVDGNPVLSEETNKAFNQNSDLVLEEFKPLIEDTINTFSVSIFARVFQLFSVEELFPES